MTRHSADGDSTSYRKYVINLLLIAYVFNFVDRQILSLLMEPIKLELNLSDTQLGFLSGIAFAVFYCTLGIPIARWADRGNRVTIISLALFMWSSMTALCGLASNFVQLLLARIGVGVGEAGCSPPAHSLIADYFPRSERPRAVSRYMMGVPIGILVGYLVGGWVNEYFGWRVSFLVVGVPGIILALIVKRTIREPARGRFDRGGARAGTGASRTSLRDALGFLRGQRSVWHLTAGITLATFAGYGAIQWLPSYFVRSYGMTTGELGTWLALTTGIGGFVGIYLGGELSHRFGADDESKQLRMLATATSMMPLLLIAALQMPDQHMSLASLFIFNVLYFFYYGPSFSLVQSLATSDTRALTIAIVMFAQNLVGAGLGPQAVGVLSDLLQAELGSNALKASIFICSAVSLWAAMHFWWAGRSIRRDIRRSSLGSLRTDLSSRG